jgi:hypothetical protein
MRDEGLLVFGGAAKYGPFSGASHSGVGAPPRQRLGPAIDREAIKDKVETISPAGGQLATPVAGQIWVRYSSIWLVSATAPLRISCPCGAGD